MTPAFSSLRSWAGIADCAAMSTGLEIEDQDSEEFVEELDAEASFISASFLFRF